MRLLSFTLQAIGCACIGLVFAVLVIEWAGRCGDDPHGVCVIPRPHIENSTWEYVQWMD